VTSRTSRGLRLAAATLAGACAVAIATPATAELAPPPEPVIGGPPPAGWPEMPTVDAPILLLVEGGTGQVLAARDAEGRRAVASTVKILTALTVLERAELDDVVTVGDEVEGLVGASVGLQPGDEWTVDQLLQGLLVRSGNDAAEALAAHVGDDTDGFVELMLEDAAVVGLPTGAGEVELRSPSGLGDTNRLSATDLAVLGRVALADPDLRPVLGLEEVTLPRVGTDENRNLLLSSYPGATGIKTGFTEAAGNSLVGSAQRGDRELVVVVLGGGEDPERFVDAAALLDHGFDAFELTSVAAERTLLVAGGQRSLAVADTPVTVPRGAATGLDLPLPIRVPDQVPPEVAVVVDGVEVATTEVVVDEREPAPVDGDARVGRGVVEGVHVALRAAAGAGSFAEEPVSTSR
jgi:serine-type D-Ala-D-Ala carboxypeptidase (penicillin-binding protein 5/6)